MNIDVDDEFAELLAELSSEVNDSVCTFCIHLWREGSVNGILVLCVVSIHGGKRVKMVYMCYV